MSTKIITLEERFYTGEPTVQLVTTLGRDGRALRERTSLHMSKTAGESPAMDYIRSVKPEPGKTIVLVIGLGDHETYGPNRNGDGFPSEPVHGKISGDQVLTKHFQSYDNAHVFEHHVNHDPEKAIGKVIKAFWNPQMRRVEVLESFDHDKAPHLLEKITSGQYPSKSMGCKIPYDVCFPAGTLIRTEDGHVPIEDVEVGTRVYTHLGRLREVTERFVRQDGDGRVTVQPSGTPALTMTRNHPVWILREASVRTCQGSANGKRLRHTFQPGATACTRCGALADDLLSKAEWVAAETLRAGDYVLAPVDSTAQTVEITERDAARALLLGYYLGDGHLLTERRGADRRGDPYITGFGITICNDEQEHLARVLDACARAGLKNPARVYQQGTRNACQVLVHDQEFAQWLLSHAGRYSREKRIAAAVYAWPEALRLRVLAGYCDTDGSGSDRSVRICTVNRGLALDTQRLCHTLGIPASITFHGAPTGYAGPVVTWSIFVPAGSAAALRPLSLRAARTSATAHSSSKSFFLEAYWVTPILRVTHEEGEGTVYNLSVEEDESYVAEGVIVHNCTICGNKAATRGEYCDHLKYEMGRIYPDGKQAAALNPSPRFFDSSWVIRPADRTGHMLKKVAREHAYELRMPSYELSELVEAARHKSAALGKAADMEKVVTGLPEASATSTDKGTLKLIKRYSDEIAPSEASSIPKSDVRITIEYTPDEAIGTTDAMGLPMGLKELVQYFMGRAGAEGTPSDRDLDCACKHAEALFEIFSEYPRFYDDVMKVAGLSAPRVNEKLANAIWPPSTMVQDRSLNDAALQDRKLPALPQYGASPNTDVLTFTDPSGQTYRTNMGMARRATNALEPEAYGKKYMRGAGYMGLGTLLGTAGLGSLLLGKRTPMRTFLGGTAIGGGLAAGAKGLHEMARPLRVGDLPGPKVMTNEGYTIPAYTEMKAAAWRPEMLYTVLRHRDGGRACATLEPQRKLAFQNAVRRAEVHDDLSAVLGPTLELEKVALLLEQSISTLA